MTRPSQKMQLQWINLDKLIPYARNPRKNDNAVSKTAGSIKEFGWKQPIVVDKDYVIVAGHTRLMAAQQLGLGKAPVVIADDLSPEQVKAYRLADNRVGEEAEWGAAWELSPGDVAYVWHAGTKAGEMTGRACYAMEISPAYVDIAVRRWQEFTGRLPCLNGKETNLTT